MSADRKDPRGKSESVCNVCGETFVSLEGYREKLRKEIDWARIWVEWSHEQAAPETVPASDDGLASEAG